MMFKSILFDMDGTLIDPSEGIFDSLRYALQQLEVPPPPAEMFPAFIGPPLREIFGRLLNTREADTLEQAVALYRRRYTSSGLFQCVVYEGIFDLLGHLTGRGYDLYVATIKPDPYARKILAHTGLAPFLRAIHGSDLAGSLDEKDILVKGVLDDHGLSPAESVMVGDRYMDVDAAKANGLVSIGVTYGFGTREEILDAGADHLADSPGAIVEIVDSLNR
jgi:phosphoglycolate phosphatase